MLLPFPWVLLSGPGKPLFLGSAMHLDFLSLSGCQTSTIERGKELCRVGAMDDQLQMPENCD
jgi:hypothetical protein